MFKKFKEKVIESQTSQRFQQITQSVSDKFQNLDKDENFFSLTEDDNAIVSPIATQMEAGFSNISLSSTSQDRNRHRRTSTSSMTSDTSFIPRYDSVSSIYHLQSDLDISASELEDNASTTSSQVGHLSKEQIYAAFQKSQRRYHKYRGRYTDLANHYKNLEREFSKLKSELEKTQERSFRRVKELKEQSELEQKAKAHLESSLRVDLDEKQIQINTLKEKINFLQSNPNSSIEFDQLSKSLNELKHENEHLNGINQEIKAKLIVLQSKESENKEKIKQLLEDNERLKVDEREINLKLAESKMQVHNELLSKEAELNSLRHENDNLKKSLDQLEMRSSGNTKIEQLQSQNQNLIEKVETLSQKCQSLSNEMLKIEQYKLEIQNLKTKISEEKSAHAKEIIAITKEAESFKEKLFNEKQDREEIIDNLEKLMFNNEEVYKKEIKELQLQIVDIEKEFNRQRNIFEEEIFKIRENAKKGLISVEDKVKTKYEKDFREKEEKLKMEYENNLKKFVLQEDKKSDLQVEFIKCQDNVKKLTEEKKILTENLFEKTEKYNELEKSYIELNDDVTREMGKCSKLEKKVQTMEGMEEKISRLQANIFTLQKENKELEAVCGEQKKAMCKVVHNTKSLNSLENVQEELKLLKLEKSNEALEKEHYRKLKSELDETKTEKNRVTHEFEIVKEEFTKLSEMKDIYSENIRDHEDEFKSAGIDREKIGEPILNECDKCFKEKNSMKELFQKIEEDFKETCKRLEESEAEKNILQAKLNEMYQNNEEIMKKDHNLMVEHSEGKELSENICGTMSENCNLKHVADYNKLLNQKEDLEKLYKELNDKLKISEMKLKNQECERNEYTILTVKIKELENLYKQSLKNHEESVMEILDRENTILAMKQELSSKEDILNQKEKELKEAKILLDNHERKLNDLQSFIHDLEKAQENNLKLLDEKNANVNLLTREIDVKIQFIKNLEENYNVLDKNKNELKKELEKYKSEYEMKSKDLLDIHNQLTTSQKLYSTEKKDIMKQLNELEQVEKNYFVLLDENENLKEQISEIALLQEKLKSLSEVEIEKNILLDNFKQLEIDIKILEEEKFQYNKKLAKMSELEEQYGKLVVEHKKLLEGLNDIEKAKQEIFALENEHSSIVSSLKNWEEKYNILLKEHERLTITTKLEKEELNMKYHNLDQMYHNLLLKNNEVVEHLSSTKEEKLFLQSKIEEALAENITLQKEIELMKIENEDLSLRNLEFEDTKKKLESICVMMEEEKSSLLNEISNFKVENGDFSSRNLELKASEKELESLKEIMEMEKTVLIDENTKLKSEIEHLKTEIGNMNLRTLKTEASKKELQSMNEIIYMEKEDLINEISKLQKNIKKINIVNQNLDGSLSELNELDKKYNNVLKEKEEIVCDFNKLKEENQILHQKNKEIKSDYKHISEDNCKLIAELEELKLNIENYSAIKIELEEKYITLNNEKEDIHIKLKAAIEEIERLKHDNCSLREMKLKKINSEVEYLDVEQNYYEMKTKYNELSIENKKLQNKIEQLNKNLEIFKEEKRRYEFQINELERHQNEFLNEKQLLKEEIEELKTSPLNLNNTTNPDNATNLDISKNENGLEKHSEMHQMTEKVTQLKSLDITNKATIEFYKNEVQKLKNSNEKLNRKLDETLVTLSHCSELSHSTELEYLKNVLYNYMLGKEGLVLTRVIATVCKFDDEQTEEVLKKEQQKQTLLAKLGLL